MLPGRIPFYNLIKLAFTIWMFSSRTRGSLLVYERAMRPVYNRLESVLANSSFLKAPSIGVVKANLAKAAAQEKPTSSSSSNLGNVQQRVKKTSEDFVGEAQSGKSQSASAGSINKDKTN